MASQKVHWAKEQLEKNPIGWSISGNKPLPSPYPWTVRFVLSIDGGGIRGYSSLIILQALMEELGKIERAQNPKVTSSICSSTLGPLDDETCAAPEPDVMPISEYRPCHYFDFIAGTGTGGIIATMLGERKMSISEAMETYRAMCTTVVERQLTRWLKRVFPRGQKASRCSNAHTMKVVPASSGPNEDEGDLQSDPKRCRTIVYEASPYYNNPSRTVLTEISSLPHHSLSGNSGIGLLSIGGAINEPVNPRADRLQFLMSKHIQRIHEELSTRSRQFNLNPYCRLDVPDDNLRNIPMNEWKPQKSNSSTLRRIEEASNAYLQNEAVSTKIHDFATALVEKRVQGTTTRQ